METKANWKTQKKGLYKSSRRQHLYHLKRREHLSLTSGRRFSHSWRTAAQQKGITVLFQEFGEKSFKNFSENFKFCQVVA